MTTRDEPAAVAEGPSVAPAPGDDVPAIVTRRRLPAAERRRQIIEVAQDVFLEVGFAGARTKDIAARAGLAEAILYRHFASKDEMFEAAILLPLEELVEELLEHALTNPLISEESEHLEQAHRLHEHRMRVMLKIAPLWMVALMADDRGPDGFYSTKIAPLVDKWCDALQPYFDARGIETDVRSVGLALLGMYGWVVLDALARGVEPDVERVSHNIADLVVLGTGRFDSPARRKGSTAKKVPASRKAGATKAAAPLKRAPSTKAASPAPAKGRRKKA